MRGLSGLGEADWLVVAAALVAIAVGFASRRTMPGRRLGPFLLAPLATAILGFLTLVVLRWSSFRALPNGRAIGVVAFVLAAVAVAYLAVDFWFSRVLVPVLAARTRGHDRWIVVLVTGPVLVMVCGVLVATAWADRIDADPAVAVTTTTTTTAATTTTTSPPVAVRHPRFELVASHGLPGSPMAVAVVPYRDLGFVSLGEGSVVRFSLSDLESGAPIFVPVVDGLEYPRGIAVVGDTLIVAELGPLPCAEPFPSCRGAEADPGGDRHRGEVRTIEGSSGRLTAYSLAEDGSVVDRRVLVDGLPVASTDHGINGLLEDGDGVLVAIGNIDQLIDAPDEVSALHHPRLDLLGTVLRVSLDGDVTVVATGLRNVYGLASGGGELWGVDNDGPTFRGWMEEEVLSIKEGADYGFPDEGTYAPYRRRTDTAVWVTDAVGSAGIAWGENVGLDDALLSGNCGRIDFIDLVFAEGVHRVPRPVATPVAIVRGCVTGIATYGPHSVVATVFQPGFSVLALLHVVG